jgi:glycosyltransferase involved in cell wall biosynthesis
LGVGAGEGVKILLVDQFGEMGGGQRCLLEAVMGFRERGWDVVAAIPSGSFETALEPYCNSIYHLPCGPFTAHKKAFRDRLRFGWQLPLQASVIGRIASDAIYVNGPRVLPAAALGRRSRPVIYHAHWMPPQRSAARLAKMALRWSRASAIAPSNLAARWLADAVDSDRIFAVSNGVGGAGFQNCAGRPRPAWPDWKHIAVLGRISREKGQLEFVRAAQIVSARLGGLRFTICGASMFGDDGYSAAVKREGEGLVHFKDWTEDPAAFLRDVDLLVVPSQGIDHVPRVILEAFSVSVPVMAFASGAIPELIQHGETGLLVRERTPEDLAQAILAAMGRPDLLEDIAARAHQRWRESYTLPRFQSEICGVVETVLRRHHQRTPLKSAGASAPA